MHALNSWRASNRKLRASSLLAVALTLGAGVSAMAADPGSAHVAIPYDQEATTIQTAKARFLGHQNPQTPVDLDFVLPLRNKAVLDALIKHIYDPQDALYKQYLTSEQFAQQFGPTQSDYDAVVQYAESVGLTVVGGSQSRTLIHVRGTTDNVESALGIRFNRYLMPDQRVGYAAQGIPSVPKEIADRITGIAGLNDLASRHHHHVKLNPFTQSLRAITSHAGSGPTGGLAPSDVRTAYDVPTTVHGEGQSVALYELEGYNTSDITTYTNQFKLPAAHLTNVPVDGFDGTVQDTGAEAEVVLDIDMVLIMAPKIGTIYVYEALNTGATALDEWQKIADDNITKVVSTSWGLPESILGSTEAHAENTIFSQMAAQGQTIYDASGDDGAFDDRTNKATLVVDDPAGQPFITGVGGTTLSTDATFGYKSETTWTGSGGGKSIIWDKPSYQTGFSGFSPATTVREVPDVAFNADPNTGYDIYVADDGGWLPVGGTSAAAPLWAGFTALVNQTLAVGGLPPVGFVNPALYNIAGGSNYATAFHDITTGTNNGPNTSGGYNAAKGYDVATGLGTFQGQHLFQVLAQTAGQVPGTITGIVTDQNGAPINTTATPPTGAVTVTALLTSTGAVASSTTTDATGAFTLNLVDGVNYTLEFDATGYAGAPQSNLFITAPSNTLAVTEKMSPTHTYAAGLQMISAPAEFSAVGDFSQLFGLTDDPPVGSDPVLFSFQPDQNRYVATPAFPADTLHNGAGYWIRLSSATSLHRLGVPAPTNKNFLIPLQKGWNIIGTPFASSIAVSKIGVAPTDAPAQTVSFATSTKLGLGDKNNVMWTYPAGGGTFPNGSGCNAVTASGAYSDGFGHTAPTLTAIDPYVGYWLYANTPCLLVVPPPAP